MTFLPKTIGNCLNEIFEILSKPGFILGDFPINKGTHEYKLDTHVWHFEYLSISNYGVHSTAGKTM